MKVALIVGRFQPFHNGHLYLLKKTLEAADKMILAVGSSNVLNEDNPLSFEIRVKMLEKVIKEEGLSEKVLKIVPSPDDPSDDIWLKLLLKNAGKFDIAVGNNDWTNGILKDAGYKVLEIKYLNRDIYQGVVIRQLFKTGGNWQTLVPEYLIEFINKEFSKSTL